MFNSLLGHGGGRETTGNKNTVINIDPGIFDDEAAASYFTYQLQPQQGRYCSHKNRGRKNPQSHRGGSGDSGSGDPTRGASKSCPTPISAPARWGGGDAGGPAPRGMENSSIETALQKLGHTMYELATINTELLVQIAVTPGNATSHNGFCNFMANIKQF